MWTFRSVPKIVFGKDAREELETIVGRRGMIISDRNLYDFGFVENVEEKMNFDTEVILEVRPEPSTDDVENMVPLVNDYNPDWIIALGGGSVIDAAKALWVLYENPDILLEEIVPFTDIITGKKAQFIAIPTTSGTGSEVTWAIVLNDKAEERKLELASPAVIPNMAIIDPYFTLEMPPSLTADTGIDALANCIEAYTSEWRNTFSDAFAINPIPDIFQYLPKAYENGQDFTSREKMHIAATLSGLAFTNSQAGVAHSLAHAIGVIFHLPHGRAVALSLPYAIDFNKQNPEVENKTEIIRRYMAIGRLLGVKGENNFEIVEGFTKKLRNLLNKLKEPSSLKEIGISKNMFSEKLEYLVTLANESTCTFVNARVPSDEEFEKLFICLFEGIPVTF